MEKNFKVGRQTTTIPGIYLLSLIKVVIPKNLKIGRLTGFPQEDCREKGYDS